MMKSENPLETRIISNLQRDMFVGVAVVGFIQFLVGVLLFSVIEFRTAIASFSVIFLLTYSMQVSRVLNYNGFLSVRMWMLRDHAAISKFIMCQPKTESELLSIEGDADREIWNVMDEPRESYPIQVLLAFYLGLQVAFALLACFIGLRYSAVIVSALSRIESIFNP